MSSGDVKISVVIPVKNGAPWLDACIHGIMQQSLFHQTEIIAIDSGSTDDSLAILEKYPIRVYTIPPAEFNHGLTRNYGVELSRGQYVVMTVQDARPVDKFWLQKLLSGFTVFENVAGVCGNQVCPHDRDKNPIDWHRPQSEPKMHTFKFSSKEEFDILTPQEKKWTCSWDDVNAMYRRETLMHIPFRKISYGEDAVWAREALQAGYAIVYNPAAMVYHYHNEDFNFSFRRSLTVMHLRYRQFGFLYEKPASRLIDKLRTIKTIWKSEPLTLKEKWYWFQYNQQQHKAFKAAHETFFKALSQGEEKLDEVHEQFCGKPPVPLK